MAGSLLGRLAQVNARCTIRAGAGCGKTSARSCCDLIAAEAGRDAGLAVAGAWRLMACVGREARPARLRAHPAERAGCGPIGSAGLGRARAARRWRASQDRAVVGEAFRRGRAAATGTARLAAARAGRRPAAGQDAALAAHARGASAGRLRDASAAFLLANPTGRGRSSSRAIAEGTITDPADHELIRRFFEDRAPLTTRGTIRYAEALFTGRQDDRRDRADPPGLGRGRLLGRRGARSSTASIGANC